MKIEHYPEYRLKMYIENMILSDLTEKFSQTLEKFQNKLEYFTLIYFDYKTSTHNYNTTYNYDISVIKIMLGLWDNNINAIHYSMDCTYVGIFSDKKIDKNIIAKIKILDDNVGILPYEICYSCKIDIYEKINTIYNNFLQREEDKLRFTETNFYKQLQRLNNENNT